jgi:hypothetical protein
MCLRWAPGVLIGDKKAVKTKKGENRRSNSGLVVNSNQLRQSQPGLPDGLFSNKKFQFG